MIESLDIKSSYNSAKTKSSKSKDILQFIELSNAIYSNRPTHDKSFHVSVDEIDFVFCLMLIFSNSVFAYDTYMSPELSRQYNKQQQRGKDSKGNTILITPHYKSYEERNENVSEKIVAIYDKKAPEGAYGARYVLYTPIKIGNKVYVGYHKVMQPSPNGFGYDSVWDGGEFSDTPCFETVDKARHYYYPQWY